MRVKKVFDSLDNLKNSIFLAGPCPRQSGIPDWREEVISLFQKNNFDGDILNPTNNNYEQADYTKQVEWELEGMMKASVVFFWIPRTEKNPGFTTNIELGQYINLESTFVGFPKDSFKNEYIEKRLELIGKKLYLNVEEMVKDVVNRFNAQPKDFFISDTHFSAERTLKLSRRPFKTIKEMDLQLISNWNKAITSNDTVYFLGDFGNINILSVLNFKKMYFIKGNYEENLEEIKDERVILVDKDSEDSFYLDENTGKIYKMVHEPLCGEKYDFFLFGHVHRLQTVKRNGINVGCDCYNFKPITTEEIEFLRNGIENHFDENVFTEYCK